MGSICLENLFLPFDSKTVSCKQHMLMYCFLIQFAILCLLIGVLRQFTFSANIERCLWFPVIFIPLLFTFTYSLFTGLLARNGLSFLESSYLTLVSSFLCKSHLNIFCSAGLLVIHSLSFSLLRKVLISPSIRKDSFAG
jgi:hypothetical protein